MENSNQRGLKLSAEDLILNTFLSFFLLMLRVEALSSGVYSVIHMCSYKYAL